MLHFDEKRGKSPEIPVRRNSMNVIDICRMVKRRFKDAGLLGLLSPS